jgi:ubiquinone/menaquinone biosynthesis C-methylase UbiE
MHHEHIVDLYERHARDFDRDRNRSLQEKAWLDRFIKLLGSERTVLDVGCGMGEPLAGYLLEQGCRVTGVDSSPSMIAMCRSRFPGSEWVVNDMRRLGLGRPFDAPARLEWILSSGLQGPGSRVRRAHDLARKVR